MRFRPTGDIDEDCARFLVGVGREDLLRLARELHLPLDPLAEDILMSHRQELDRLRTGEPTHWLDDDDSEAQLQTYHRFLEVEERLLTAIISGESSPG